MPFQQPGDAVAFEFPPVPESRVISCLLLQPHGKQQAEHIVVAAEPSASSSFGLSVHGPVALGVLGLGVVVEVGHCGVGVGRTAVDEPMGRLRAGRDWCP